MTFLFGSSRILFASDDLLHLLLHAVWAGIVVFAIA